MVFESDKSVILGFFSRQLRECREGPEQVGWHGEESQSTRFRILSEVDSLEGCTILDVGCGLGGFLDFLSQHEVQPRKYVGVDINPMSVETAAQRHPNELFFCRDILEDPFEEKFDFVVASGIFNLATPHAHELTFATFYQMYELCEKGIAVNFLSEWSPFPRNEKSVYYDPEMVLDFVLEKLSHRVVLRHDYRPNDFTFYVYRSDRGE